MWVRQTLSMEVHIMSNTRSFGALTAALLVAAATGGCMDADSAEAPGNIEAWSEADAILELPEGATLTFAVDETVSTASHEAGSRFTSHLTADAVGSDGQVVLPTGSLARWEVVESASDNGEGVAVLAVRLVHVESPEGWVPLEATVIASDITTDNPDSDKETAAKIGIGAAAGAVLGAVLGDDAQDALKGAGVGAAMGTVVALSTREGSATLPQGSTITVSLDQPLEIRGE